MIFKKRTQDTEITRLELQRNITENLIPEKNHQKNSSLICITLIHTDINHITQTIYTRWVWDKAENYPEYIKEYEIEWLRYSIWLWGEESKKYNIPVFDTTERQYEEKIMAYIKNPLSHNVAL
jgi:hypothetical protein